VADLQRRSAWLDFAVWYNDRARDRRRGCCRPRAQPAFLRHL